MSHPILRMIAALVVQVLAIVGTYYLISIALSHQVSDLAAFVLSVLIAPTVLAICCLALFCALLVLGAGVLFLPVWLSYLWNGEDSACAMMDSWFSVAGRLWSIDNYTRESLTNEALFICQEIDDTFDQICKGSWKRY